MERFQQAPRTTKPLEAMGKRLMLLIKYTELGFLSYPTWIGWFEDSYHDRAQLQFRLFNYASDHPVIEKYSEQLRRVNEVMKKIGRQHWENPDRSYKSIRGSIDELKPIAQEWIDFEMELPEKQY